MNTFRIVPTIGGVNLLEAAPGGRSVISRRFPTDERAKMWLLMHLGMANLATLERWLLSGGNR
jgi:hypothetical protein